jgi:hypothetical protein
MQPKSIDELNAEVDVELINNGKDPVSAKSWQDHLTYIYAYYSAQDSNWKYQAIEDRKNLYMQEGWDQAKLAQAQAAWQDGTMWNIAASNASQQTSAQVQDWMNQPVWNINAAWI